MEYFYLPINKKDYDSSPPFNYHKDDQGNPLYGKLDMAANGGGIIYTGNPIYSMTAGTVRFNGNYTECTALVIEPKIQTIGRTYYIRYLHGDFDSNLTEGTEVKMGQLIGTINGHYNYNPHLHIDFSYKSNTFVPVIGTLTLNTYTINNNIFNIHTDQFDYNKILHWCELNGLPYSSTSTPNIGFCWIIFAAKLDWKEPSPVPSEDILKITNKYNTCPSNPTDDRIITAYYEKNLSEEFCGAFPTDWVTLCSEACHPIRCVLDFCKHEWGTFSNPFVRMGLVKMWRAGVIGNNTLWAYAQRGGNDNSNFYKLLENACKVAPDDNYGSWNSNDGTNFISQGETSERLVEAQMAYYNFRYPDIYGSTTINNGSQNFTNALVNAINLLPTNNNKSSNWFSQAKFIYNWNMITDQDDGTYVGLDANHAVLSRLSNDDGTKAYHPEILE